MALSEAQKKERSEYLERNLEITECSQGKPYVFISYASDNWKAVFKDAVVPLQQTYGLRAYADKAFDKVNDKWIVPMLRNIRGADAVVVFISQKYIESYACFLELLTAVNSRKPIVFVSLEQELRLGDTTDLPEVERGVKNEILNQGANLSTNTNNTSNDLMRAMKSAYTSISTLLEQDALSKFDISDAFINFFRDASVNRKTINDLKAVKRTISSVSKEVYDKALIIKPEQTEAAVPSGGGQDTEAAAVQTAPAQTDGAPADASELPEDVQRTEDNDRPITVYRNDDEEDAPVSQQAPPVFSFDAPKKSGGKNKLMAILIAGGVCVLAIIIVVVIAVSSRGSDRDERDRDDVDVATIDDDNDENNEDDSESKDDEEEDDDSEVRNEEDSEAQDDEDDSNEEDTPPLNGQQTIEYDNGDVYIGEVVNGEPNGYGVMQYDNGDVYGGEWTDGKCNGCGTIRYENGNTYMGEWKDGQRNGQGTVIFSSGQMRISEWDGGERLDGYVIYIWPSGQIYAGEDKRQMDGTIISDGSGTMTYEGGAIYSGELLDLKRNGQGTLISADGTVQTGIWEEGTYIGESSASNGIETVEYDSGDVYIGEFADGMPNGYGIMLWADGAVYGGEWVDGKYDGYGTVRYASGDIYTGEWKEGLRNGQGTVIFSSGQMRISEWDGGERLDGYVIYIWPSGTIYAGEDKRQMDGTIISDGPGTMIYGDGAIYSGELLNLKRNGQGTMISADGTVQSGTWENDEFVGE